MGASSEIDAYRGDQARLAVVEEHRRMARELHDGLVQELSFIRRRRRPPPVAWRSPAPGMAEHLAAAADRALRESRRAVDALPGDMPESLADALRTAADDVAVRAGTAVSLTGRGPDERAGRRPPWAVPVLREATSNAVRDGRATSVVIRVERPGVGGFGADDGNGFDVGAARTGGFGLRSMCERAEKLGGSLAVRSEPGSGTGRPPSRWGRAPRASLPRHRWGTAGRGGPGGLRQEGRRRTPGRPYPACAPG